jgi:hypothetical protein
MTQILKYQGKADQNGLPWHLGVKNKFIPASWNSRNAKILPNRELLACNCNLQTTWIGLQQLKIQQEKAPPK